RYSSSSSSSNSYEWTYPSLTSGGTTVYADITISAYLAYSSWTDTAAVYGAQYYTFSSKDIGVLNQNKAPNGYSEMSATFKSETGGHLSSYAYIKPSGNTNQTTGADQIKVTISY
ncbi:MAG: hypothetical protein IJ366_07735, partial [Clostridia bacterium]|nr:hypothetical protein [Clostridia bacterium]